MKKKVEGELFFFRKLFVSHLHTSKTRERGKKEEEKWETFFPLSSRMGSEGRERGGGGGGGQQPNSDHFCR